MSLAGRRRGSAGITIVRSVKVEPEFEHRSEAIVLYLGRGMAPYPKRDPERLITRFGGSEGLDLVTYAEEVLREMYEVSPDWASEDLPAATRRAVRRVAEGHPDLSEEALDALRWSYGWDWK
jgi:hypothetical protein